MQATPFTNGNRVSNIRNNILCLNFTEVRLFQLLAQTHTCTETAREVNPSEPTCRAGIMMNNWWYNMFGKSGELQGYHYIMSLS